MLRSESYHTRFLVRLSMWSNSVFDTIAPQYRITFFTLASLETLVRCTPVHHIPDSFEILCLPVLVLQVVCVLPRIDAQKRSELFRRATSQSAFLETLPLV